jgi:hypothetical protein
MLVDVIQIQMLAEDGVATTNQNSDSLQLSQSFDNIHSAQTPERFTLSLFHDIAVICCVGHLIHDHS